MLTKQTVKEWLVGLRKNRYNINADNDKDICRIFYYNSLITFMFNRRGFSINVYSHGFWKELLSISTMLSVFLWIWRWVDVALALFSQDFCVIFKYLLVLLISFVSPQNPRKIKTTINRIAHIGNNNNYRKSTENMDLIGKRDRKSFHIVFCSSKTTSDL